MLAKCHGCKEAKMCAYCGLCDHWFCDDCRSAWLNRAGAFFWQLLTGRSGDCCGPVAA